MAAGRVRAAYAALAVLFVAFGAVDGTWSARLPALKQRLDLGSGVFGVVVFVGTLAAAAILPVAGLLTARRGSRGPTAAGLLVASLGLTAAAFAPTLGALVPAVCVLGVGVGTADVAANSHGIALEHRLERPILSGLHGTWSVGLLLGSAVAAAAAASGISPRVQFPVVALAVTVAVAAATPHLLAGTAADVDSAHFALPRGALALPAFLFFCALFVESAALSWTAVFLSGPVGAGAAVAATGVAVYAVAMTVARFAGDRLLVRWSVGGLARRSGLLTCVGMTLALVTRAPAPALVGIACVGAGSAAIVPALFRVAGTMPGVAAGAGIAACATAGYAGAVVNGPVIGFAAHAVGLTWALSLVVVAAGLVALLGPRLGR